MTTLSVSVTHNGYPVRGHLHIPTTSAPKADLVVLFHGTITAEGDHPLAAAQKFLEYATSPTVLNIGDRLIFSVAYPQDDIPNWSQEAAADLFPGINIDTFYLGDNIPYAQAALDWAQTSIDSYLAANNVPLSRDRIFAFGHSQGALLVHRLNRIYELDGVVVNAPGPIDLLSRCAYSETHDDENGSCAKIKWAYGSTATAPSAYEDVSLKNYLDNLLSPSLYTQALDDSGGIKYGVSQVDAMKNIVEPGLSNSPESAPVTFRYYSKGGHPVFSTNALAQRDIREFLTSVSLSSTQPSPDTGGNSGSGSNSGSNSGSGSGGVPAGSGRAIAICNFIQLVVPGTGTVIFSYQNFFINQSSSVGGTTYNFLPFAITSGAGKKGGDRASASLVLTPNDISINILAEAAESRMLLQVRTYEVDALSMSLRGLITDELWSINRMEYDTEKAVLQLISPLDAVGNQVPRRYLSSKLVGALPTSGRLTLS